MGFFLVKKQKQGNGTCELHYKANCVHWHYRGASLGLAAVAAVQFSPPAPPGLLATAAQPRNLMGHATSHWPTYELHWAQQHLYYLGTPLGSAAMAMQPSEAPVLGLVQK